jgi:hypothetical protein
MNVEPTSPAANKDVPMSDIVDDPESKPRKTTDDSNTALLLGQAADDIEMLLVRQCWEPRPLHTSVHDPNGS